MNESNDRTCSQNGSDPVAERHLLAARQKFTRGDKEGAFQEVSDAIRLRPDYLEAHEFRLSMHVREWDMEGIVSSTTHLISTGNASVWTLRLRAMALLCSDNYEEAISDATRAIALDPSNSDLFLARSIALGKAGRTREAMSDVRHVLHLNADGPKRKAGLIAGDKVTCRRISEGRRHLGQEEYTAAIAAFGEAISCTPNSIEAMAGRGEAYHRDGQYENACVDFSEALRLYGERGKEARGYMVRGDGGREAVFPGTPSGWNDADKCMWRWTDDYHDNVYVTLFEFIDGKIEQLDSAMGRKDRDFE
jgi:tetratricopeptide (TPR) repeat protein